MLTVVTTYYLEMISPADLRPASRRPAELEIAQAQVPSPPLNRYLYTAVGGDWHWADRLSWRCEEWMAWLDRPELETWVAYYRGTPAGYFELEMQEGGSVEIAYFGLLGQFFGLGIGGTLLTCAIERGWAMGARRVWVHTCTLDHPNALDNYRARGLRVFKTATAKVAVGEAPGPWPGAFG